MTVLVIAEHDNRTLSPAMLPVITAACQLGDEVGVLLAGHECGDAVTAACAIDGVSRVYVADAPQYEHGLAEELAPLIIAQVTGDTSHVVAPASTFGKNLMPRVAALLDVAQVSDITTIISPDTFVRPIYAGNALATVRSSDRVKVITIRTTAFAPAAIGPESAQPVTIEALPAVGLSSFIDREFSVSERPELTTARVVISGGRGFGTAENFSLIEGLADRLGAAIGASRAAVDAGYVSNDYQVGQTGKVVAPELYIAVGISGAIQHLAGMKDSKVIVAINKDADAPIFEVADYGLVGDLFEVIPALCAALDGLNQGSGD